MTDTPKRGSVAEVAELIGRSETSIRKYIDQTTDARYTPPGAAHHPLGLESHVTGLTLDVELTRAYAASRPKGRPSKWTGQGA